MGGAGLEVSPAWMFSVVFFPGILGGSETTPSLMVAQSGR